MLSATPKGKILNLDNNRADSLRYSSDQNLYQL